MRSTLTILPIVLGLLLAGCATSNKVLVCTGTVIGVEIAENPSTGLYHAKLGYNRAELALVPTTNGYVPDVLVELQFTGLFNKSGGIYQRLAVGPVAVSQPGAMAMFLKDASGQVGTNVPSAIEALKKSFSATPVLDAGVRLRKAKLATSYSASTVKMAWDAAASKAGYSSFSDFLVETNTTTAQCDSIESALKTNGVSL